MQTGGQADRPKYRECPKRESERKICCFKCMTY